MEIDVIFKIAAVGIIVTIFCQILKKSDRKILRPLSVWLDSSSC